MSILNAVVSTNAEELEKILLSGWTPPSIRHKHAGHVRDYAVWTEAVLRDWIEGLRLLDKFFPEMSLNTDIWEMALKTSSIDCVKFLWERNGFQADLLSSETQKRWITFLMEGMGDPWSPPHAIKNILPVYTFISEKGLDTAVAIPGDFEPSDFRLQGHSLFTRALFIKNWKLAQEFWPKSYEEWRRWPRLNEVLFHIMNVVTGDYKVLIDESSFSETTEEDILLRWLEEFGKEWLESSSHSREVFHSSGVSNISHHTSSASELIKGLSGAQNNERYSEEHLPTPPSLRELSPSEMDFEMADKPSGFSPENRDTGKDKDKDKDNEPRFVGEASSLENFQQSDVPTIIRSGVRFPSLQDNRGDSNPNSDLNPGLELDQNPDAGHPRFAQDLSEDLSESFAQEDQGQGQSQSQDEEDQHEHQHESVAQNREYVPLYRLLSRPSQEKISPWLRLPLMLQSPRRKIIWDIWEYVLEHDPEHSWLHELAMYPDDADVQNVVLLARHDTAMPFHRFWARPSASGFSAHERWVSVGGDETLVQAWVPVT